MNAAPPEFTDIVHGHIDMCVKGAGYEFVRITSGSVDKGEPGRVHKNPTRYCESDTKDTVVLVDQFYLSME